MKITDVERIVVNVPFTERLQDWNVLLPNVWNWSIIEVIRVQTDNGLVGYGETLLQYGWGLVPEEAIFAVRGKNPAEFLNDDRLGPGLQMAIYDIVGKALEVPVSTLIGTRVRKWCPIAWWNTKMSPQALAEEARDAVDAGYMFHKFKARPWIDVYEQVEAISAVTPPGYRLDIDWNAMLLTAGDAVPVLQELDKYERVAIYETPIPHADLEGYREIRSKIARPVSDHVKTNPFPAWIHSGAVDGFVNEGGIATMRMRGQVAAEFGKLFWLQMVGAGLTTALSAHLGSVLTHARWPAVTCLNNYSDDLLVDALTIEGGYLKVPDGPGLGVEVDETALERYRMEPPYELPERRHLLSVVWPNGRTVHYTQMKDGVWTDFLAGNHPVQERGVRMDIRTDDGSKEFSELYARASLAPVHTFTSA